MKTKGDEMKAVRLTAEEIDAVMESLCAHFAGDTSEGDLCWSAKQHKAAERALTKLLQSRRYVSIAQGEIK
jgi:hypothetical protein